MASAFLHGSGLEAVVGMKITSLDDLRQALQNRAVYFKKHGCRLSDHSFGAPDFTRFSESEAARTFTKALAGESVSQQEIDNYQAVLLDFLGGLYDQLDFTMQLHMGVLRNLNSAIYKARGGDLGFDSIGGQIEARSVAALLDRMAQKGCLPKIILYSLNPTDNDKLATIAGCFQAEGIKSKIQLGAAWWYNDTINGMEAQMKSLSNIGLLSSFIGMLTDSRSALSYTRHEYFRRVLCNLIGSWIERGLAPADYNLVGRMVEDICYNNAVAYIGF
jgi:glucuronate isomerase